MAHTAGDTRDLTDSINRRGIMTSFYKVKGSIVELPFCLFLRRSSQLLSNMLREGPSPEAQKMRVKWIYSKQVRNGQDCHTEHRAYLRHCELTSWKGRHSGVYSEIVNFISALHTYKTPYIVMCELRAKHHADRSRVDHGVKHGDPLQ